MRVCLEKMLVKLRLRWRAGALQANLSSQLAQDPLNAMEVRPVEGQPMGFRRGRNCTHDRAVRIERSRFATTVELSASIVHQINQPLMSMLANAQAAKRWLAAESPNVMEAIASMDRITRDVRAAGETVERIRALFKQGSFVRKKVRVFDMMSEASRLVLQDPNKCDIPIAYHLDENLPMVNVDPVAIREVFINLTSNAMEAMEHTWFPQVKFWACVTEQNEMLIQVIDNGPGIRDTEAIFDAFVTTKKNGLGIGLTVARSIAEAHDGHLWAENHPSGGAMFCLALPLSSGQ